LAAFIRAGAESLKVDPACLGLPALVAAASAIGGTRQLVLNRSWSERPILWGALVMPSGYVKTSGLDVALKPIYLRQKNLQREYRKARAEFESSQEAWKATPREERGNQPLPPPPMQHAFCSDVTVEALAVRLEATPRGTLVAVDELTTWLASFGRYNNGATSDRAAYLSLHSGKALKVDRKKADTPTIYVEHPTVNIVGGIQPRVLRRLLAQDDFDSGLVGRILVATPPVRAKTFHPDGIDHEIEERYGRLIADLYQLQPSTDANAEQYPAHVNLSAEAVTAWSRFVEEHGLERHALGDSDLGAAWAKLEGCAARLSLVIHCLRQVTGEPVEPWTCDEQSILAGIALVRWFGSETRRLYAMFSETEEDQERRELVQLVERLGGQVTPREIARHTRRFPTAESAEAALAALVDAGRGSWQVVGGERGRPKTLFILEREPTDADLRDADSVDVDKSTKNCGKAALVSTSTPLDGEENRDGSEAVEVTL
jgi:hypothetical protein